MTTFQDEIHLSGEEKAAILADWQRFIRGGFDLADFTPALYDHLKLRAGFIAHHDRERFWQRYFMGSTAL